MVSDEHDDHRHLERVHDALGRAEDRAGREIREQVQSVQEGLFEEEGDRAEAADAGGRTQLDPGPKGDRIAELEKKLRGLEAEAEGDATKAHIDEAVSELAAYRDERTGEPS